MSGLLESELARILIGDLAKKLGATAADQDKLMASLGDFSPNRDLRSSGPDRYGDDRPPGQFPREFPRGAHVVGAGFSTRSSWLQPYALLGVATPAATVGVAQRNAAVGAIVPGMGFWVNRRPFAKFGKAMVSNASVTKVKLGASLRDRFQMDMILGAASPLAAKRLLENSSKGAPRDVRAAIEGSSVHYWPLLDGAERFARIMTIPWPSSWRFCSPQPVRMASPLAAKAGH
jgi:hypothetical protein